MAGIDYKKLYSKLLKERKALLAASGAQELEVATELPEDFNQTGWALTIEAVEALLVSMKEFEEVKGERLTPQFYKPVFHRATVAKQSIDKIVERIKPDPIEDYEQACTDLMIELKGLKSTTATETEETEELETEEQE